MTGVVHKGGFAEMETGIGLAHEHGVAVGFREERNGLESAPMLSVVFRHCVDQANRRFASIDDGDALERDGLTLLRHCLPQLCCRIAVERSRQPHGPVSVHAHQTRPGLVHYNRIEGPIVVWLDDGAELALGG